MRGASEVASIDPRKNTGANAAMVTAVTLSHNLWNSCDFSRMVVVVEFEGLGTASYELLKSVVAILKACNFSVVDCWHSRS